MNKEMLGEHFATILLDQKNMFLKLLRKKRLCCTSFAKGSINPNCVSFYFKTSVCLNRAFICGKGRKENQIKLNVGRIIFQKSRYCWFRGIQRPVLNRYNYDVSVLCCQWFAEMSTLKQARNQACVESTPKPQNNSSHISHILCAKTCFNNS